MSRACSRSVWEGSIRKSFPCGRSAVAKDAEGRPICKLHATLDRKRAEKNRRWHAEVEAEEQREAAMERRTKEFSRDWGLAVEPHYSFNGRVTGKVVVDVDKLESILEVLSNR